MKIRLFQLFSAKHVNWKNIDLKTWSRAIVPYVTLINLELQAREGTVSSTSVHIRKRWLKDFKELLVLGCKVVNSHLYLSHLPIDFILGLFNSLFYALRTSVPLVFLFIVYNAALKNILLIFYFTYDKQTDS